MKKAFSLVELSIVLVILGLLTGGILAGQSLIRAAELRAVTTEYSRYVVATRAFRDKYFQLPGDITNATAIWGRYSTGTDCLTNSSAAVNATTGVCDGDGSATVYGAGTASGPTERFQFWRHLALAGLIEGSYSGIAGSLGGSDAAMGSVPSSKLSSGLWTTNYNGVVSASSTAFDGNYGNGFIFGARNSTTGAANDPILKPEEAWNIDTKFDDGKPGTGIVMARYWNNLCANAASSSDFSATYRLSDSTAQCALYFQRQY